MNTKLAVFILCGVLVATIQTAQPLRAAVKSQSHVQITFEQEAKTIFDAYDVEHKGYLNKPQFTGVYNMLRAKQGKAPAAAAELEAAWTTHDKNHDDKIQLGEFNNLYRDFVIIQRADHA